MSRIIVLMGKSASGKDSVYKKLAGARGDRIKTLVPYTTRPMREGEVNGKDYFFINEEEYKKLKNNNRIVEERCYDTVEGPWRYLTVNDESFEGDKDVLLIGTLEAYLSIREFFGEEKEVVPVYIECDDGDRLIRAINREKKREKPRYKELCRRFLADDEDFSEDKLENAGVTIRIRNDDLEKCVRDVAEKIWT